MKKYLSFTIVMFSVLLVASCKKFDFTYPVTGEAVGAFQLSTPADNNELLLNSATPASPIIFNWSTATKGVNQAVTYTWKLDLTTGDFSTPLWQLASDNSGSANQITLTNKSIDSLLGVKSIASNARAALKWTVVATNSSGTIQTAAPFKINITRFGIGLSAFTIFAPASSTTIQTTNPSSTTDFLNFKWQTSTATPSANAVTYKVAFVQKQFDALGNAIAPNFQAPLFTIASNTTGSANALDMSYKQMSDSLNAHGVLGLAQLQWTVIATAGTFSLQALYFNDLYLARAVRVYLPGSYQTATGNGTDWTPANAPELIRDQRSGVLNNLFYIYIYLPAGTSFKATVGRAWDVNYGPATAGATGGATVLNSSNNFSVTTAGYYRISVDINTLKYDIKEGRMGFVGDATGAGWTPGPPSVFPTYALFPAATNLFIGVTTFGNGGWKLIDNNVWDAGTKAVDETRTYGTSGGDGSTLEIGGSNFGDFSPTGRYRVIWDGRDRDNVKYNYSSATEMRVVGNGITGVADWDPPTSPVMTYSGNGIWTATLALKANMEFKFVAGNAWGAFDYEDNSGGSQALGTPRNIVWEGNANFKTPATAGTYTITLNENAQTVTIN